MCRKIFSKILPVCLLTCCLLVGCSSSGSALFGLDDPGSASRSTSFAVRIPSADGTVVYQGNGVTIDASNTANGYVMATCTGTEKQVKIQVKTPLETLYTYNWREGYEAFPLTDGDGVYTVTVFEQVVDNQYAQLFSQEIDVALSNEFSPFLYANQYVDFELNSDAVQKSKELGADAASDLEVISNIYHFVIDDISYDTDKANDIVEGKHKGYLPDIDAILASHTGICFDYAAVLTAMLRVQGIPTKLEVGYSGDVYHAWISTYVQDKGWIDGMIRFDGANWTLMDPTFASSNNSSKKILEYIGDATHYSVRFTY